MITVALGVIGPGAGLCTNGVCQFFLITAVGYPLLLRACMTCVFSPSLSGADMQILSARVRSVRATVILCARGWWESKSRYLSVWVFFLNTDMVKEPSEWRVTLVSRNGSVPSTSVLMVNWMVGSIEFRWLWNR